MAAIQGLYGNQSQQSQHFVNIWSLRLNHEDNLISLIYESQLVFKTYIKDTLSIQKLPFPHHFFGPKFLLPFIHLDIHINSINPIAMHADVGKNLPTILAHCSVTAVTNILTGHCPLKVQPAISFTRNSLLLLQIQQGILCQD